MELTLVGPGRLGRSLHLLLERAGWTVELLHRDGTPKFRAVLLTVPDGAIAEAAARIPPGHVVLHASGATDLTPLRPHAAAGSFHPLMSFPGPETALPDLHQVPAAIAGDPEALAVARQIGEALHMFLFEVTGDRRLYHASAVLAGNFATVLLAEASKVLQAAGVAEADAPRILAPLALQSLRAAAATSPAEALTGPAARGDLDTIAAHQAALAEAGLDEQAELYAVLKRAALALAAKQR